MQNFKRRKFTKILFSLVLLFPFLKVNFKSKKKFTKNFKIVNQFSKVWFIKNNDNS